MEIFSTLIGIGKAWDTVTKGNDFSKALESLGLNSSKIELIKAGGSMVGMMKNHIVEPTIVVTKSMYNRKDIDKILESTVDVYASFFIMVFKILITTHKIDHRQALSIMANKGFDHESFNGLSVGLMDLESIDALPLIDLESTGPKSASSSDVNGPSKTIMRHIEVSLDLTVMDVIKENSNKKDVTDKYTEDNINAENTGSVYSTSSTKSSSATTKEVMSTLTIPIIIKANVHVVDNDEIVNSVDLRSKSNSFYERFLKYKLGVISFKELWFAGDIVESYKKNQLNKDTFTKDLNKKANSVFKISDILNRNAGLGKMVVSYIMSDNELDVIIKKCGWDIDKKSEKDSFMGALMAFNVTSIDSDRDMASVYIHAISGSTPVPVKKLTKSSGNSDSIEMLASAMMANKLF